MAKPKPHFVTQEWTDEKIVHRYEHAFSDYMEDGTHALGATEATNYWAWVKKRAEELLPGRRVDPGVDYAITEVVRCKSKREKAGVPQAVATCADQYLGTTLELTPARVIVTVGKLAAVTLKERLGLKASSGVQEAEIAERHVLVTFLAHPAGFGRPKSFRKFANEDMKRLRDAVST